MLSQYQVKQVLIISHLYMNVCAFVRACVHVCVHISSAVYLYLECFNYSHSEHGNCSLEGIYTEGTMNTVTGNTTVVQSSYTLQISMYTDTHTLYYTGQYWTLVSKFRVSEYITLPHSTQLCIIPQRTFNLCDDELSFTLVFKSNQGINSLTSWEP